MSVYKPFTTSDVVVTPFKVNKSFSFQGYSEIIDPNVGIDRFRGTNIPYVPGFDETGYIITQSQALIYNSLKQLYYSNYLRGEDGSTVNTASFNVDGTITGQGATDQPMYENYLPNTLEANRFFPTGSEDVVGVMSIPSKLFGEYIKPGTFRWKVNTLDVTDDGEGALFAGSVKVGDIIYEHGMIILPNLGPFITGSVYGSVLYGTAQYGTTDEEELEEVITSDNITCSFESTITLYESQYKCTIRENEYNFSQNPTIISGSSNSGVVRDFATGSYFSPYVTTVGLYNNDKELLAVGKLSQPLPLSTTTDINIIINLDL